MKSSTQKTNPVKSRRQPRATKQAAPKSNRAKPKRGGPRTSAHIASRAIDTVQRAQPEEAVRQGGKLYRALIENNTDGIALVGADTTILYVSPSNERLYGYAAEEVLGRNGLELVHPEDRASEMARWADVLKTPGKTITSEIRVRHKDGSWMWAQVIRKNLLAEPSVQAIVVNYRDITQRKLAEEALRESRERYHDLVELSPDMIVVHREGKIVYVNPAGAEFAGATDSGQMTGRQLGNSGRTPGTSWHLRSQISATESPTM